jgi:threonine synthase
VSADGAVEGAERARGADGAAGGARPRLAERYRRFLPITEATPALTLGEGFTPLVAAPRLGARIGIPHLHLKLEGLNPTGSFKDRGMVIAVSKAIEAGATSIICASTGNTSASAAAYGASAGMEVAVVLPQGAIALGKLLQALIAGAKVVAVEGNFDDALRVVRSMTGAPGSRATLVNSVNPHRIAGQKTAAYEICDELGRAPDVLAIPVGNAGNITAYWAGFTDYAVNGIVETRPRMHGFQAAGAAPIVAGHPIDHPETIATAIKIGNPATWAGAVAARDESRGGIDSVTDDEILAAYRSLAELEGVFCEPSSAASVAGVAKAAATGTIGADDLVVAVLTGNGLKDPDTAQRAVAGRIVEAEATEAAVRRALGW